MADSAAGWLAALPKASLRAIVVLAMTLGCMLLADAARAGEAAKDTGLPPRDYLMADLQLVLERQFGHGQPTLLIQLSSVRGLRWQQGRQAGELTLAPDQLVAVVNDLHQARFFELPSQLPVPLTVFMRGDGRVGTQVLRPLDAGSTRLCFQLPTFRKCLQYEGTGPADLERAVSGLVQQALPPLKTR